MNVFSVKILTSITIPYKCVLREFGRSFDLTSSPRSGFLATAWKSRRKSDVIHQCRALSRHAVWWGARNQDEREINGSDGRKPPNRRHWFAKPPHDRHSGAMDHAAADRRRRGPRPGAYGCSEIGRAHV